MKAILNERAQSQEMLIRNMKKGRPRTANIRFQSSLKNKSKKTRKGVQDEVDSTDSIDHGIDLANSAVTGKISKSRPTTAKTKSIPEKGYFKRFPQRPIKGYVFFSKQKKRQPMVTRELFDHEGKQFQYLETPTVSSKHRRPQHVFDIKNSIGRKDIFQVTDDDPDYTPNYETRKRRINLGITRFDSSTGKDFSSKRSTTRNEALYNYDRYRLTNKSQLIHRIPIVDMERNLPRELDPESGLPFFMQTKRNIQSSKVLGKKGMKISLKKKQRPSTAGVVSQKKMRF